MPRPLYIKPNKAAVSAARKGLKAREKAPKSKKGGLTAMQAHEEGIGSGILRARDIIAGKKIDAYRVKAFFDRHQKNYLNAKLKGLKPEESRAIQAWLIWGGDPLYKQVKKAVERDKKKMKKNPSQLEKDYICPEDVKKTRSHPTDVELIDAAARAKEFDDFSVPKTSQIKAIQPGDYVKVGHQDERIWVLMTGYIERKFHGIAANGRLKGKPIFFMKRHIFDIQKS